MTAEKRPTSTPTESTERVALRALLAREGVTVPPSVNGATLRTLWAETLRDLHVIALYIDSERDQARIRGFASDAFRRSRSFADRDATLRASNRSDAARRANETRKRLRAEREAAAALTASDAR